MEFCGIICEFNPLTNGHVYFINEAKRKTGLNIVAMMSGNFTQRGTPAILDKFTRAELAVKEGCFAVFELPVCFSVSTAENFALGAVKTLNEMPGLTHLAFGCETEKTDLLIKIAKFLSNPPVNFSSNVKEQLNNGENYYFSTINALKNFFDESEIHEIFDGPNNILAIEYLKAIYKLKSKLIPVFIKRTDNGLNSKKAKNKFLSASAVRELVLNKDNFKDFVPKNEVDYLTNCANLNTGLNNFLLFSLRTKSPRQLRALLEFNEGIENLLLKNAQNSNSLEQALLNSVSKRYRKQKLTRLALYSAIGLTKQAFKKSLNSPSAIKLLAMKKENKSLLSCFSGGETKVVVSQKDYLKFANVSLSLDLTASNIYYAFYGFPHNYDLKHGASFV